MARRPNLVLAAEEELGITAGLQDRVVQVYGGVVYMDFDRGLMARSGGVGRRAGRTSQPACRLRLEMMGSLRHMVLHAGTSRWMQLRCRGCGWCTRRTRVTAARCTAMCASAGARASRRSWTRWPDLATSPAKAGSLAALFVLTLHAPCLPLILSPAGF